LQIITDRTFFDFGIPFIATATVLVAVWVILDASSLPVIPIHHAEWAHRTNVESEWSSS